PAIISLCRENSCLDHICARRHVVEISTEYGQSIVRASSGPDFGKGQDIASSIVLARRYNIFNVMLSTLHTVTVEALQKHRENITFSSPVEQYGNFQTKSNGVIYDWVQTKRTSVKCSKYNAGVEHRGTQAKRLCKEGCTRLALKGGKCMIHGGGIKIRKLCKQKGCAKTPQKGGKCIKHGGTKSKRLCKEEGCAKQALKGGKCMKHGGTQPKKKCNEEGCAKLAMKGGKCMKHGGTQSIKLCNEEGCTKQARKGGKCMKHGAPKRLRREENVSNMKALSPKNYVKNGATN
ncbi:unnamed protein product, partial [Timema podura]|nr:unnamed protein product [Timema podura]